MKFYTQKTECTLWHRDIHVGVIQDMNLVGGIYTKGAVEFLLTVYVGIAGGGLPGFWYQYFVLYDLVGTPDLLHCGGIYPTKVQGIDPKS